MSASRSGLPAALASALTSRETRDCQAVLAAFEAAAEKNAGRRSFFLCPLHG